MKYTLTSPCSQCPFLNNPQMRKGFSLRRLAEFAQGSFPCHQTADCVEDDDGISKYEANGKSVHCAGALIFCEKRNRPSQMMRISERLGMYDRSKLNMKTAVR